jgi:hypothetical protein
MVLCALASLSASLRSAANLLAATHKTSFLLLITQYTIITIIIQTTCLFLLSNSYVNVTLVTWLINNNK